MQPKSLMSNDFRIRVCMNCKSYIILKETFENKKKLEIFNLKHQGHTVITTNYSELPNLECGKFVCEDDDPKTPLKFEK